MRLILGIDLGQANDHSALAGVDRVKLAKPIYRRKYRYVLRVLKEMPLGVPYPEQVRQFAAVLSHPQVKGGRCGVDYTGVGRPVYDLLKDAKPGCLLYPMLTTAGHAISYDTKTREFHVPKSEQVGLLQVLLQADLLNWHPDLPSAKRFAEQLAKYRVKLSKAKNETFGAETGTNDDLVSAVMSACWLGEHTGAGDPNGITVPGAGERSAVDGAPDGVFATGNGV